MLHKYYLFDFDGTLVDSMPTFVSAMLRILDENNISYGSDIIKIITPLGLNGTAEYFIDQLGVPLPKEQLMGIMKEYMLDAYFHTIPVKAYVPEVLQALKAQGASLNVLTASPHITLDACLKRLGLWELFDNVWSCDDFDTTKADPQIYVRAAEKMHTTVENVLFLDDNLNADRTAKTAGMQVCGVYDESSKDCVEEMKAANDYYIFDFQELLKLETDKKA
jgi:HAD superfamily hydrolase (TIGR01509 family)